jgi:acylphosphatase
MRLIISYPYGAKNRGKESIMEGCKGAEDFEGYERQDISVTYQSRVRVTARITGTVQGVKYRATAQREARRRGLTGWVRNEPDGAVLIDVEGDPAAVDAFLRWCAEGPPGARVATVETTVADPVGYEEFAILRSERR